MNNQQFINTRHIAGYSINQYYRSTNGMLLQWLEKVANDDRHWLQARAKELLQNMEHELKLLQDIETDIREREWGILQRNIRERN